MAVPVQLEIFMKDLTKAGLQSVGKNVDDVETQTRQLISALQQVIAAQKKQLEVNKAAGLSYTGSWTDQPEKSKGRNCKNAGN